MKIARSGITAKVVYIVLFLAMLTGLLVPVYPVYAEMQPNSGDTIVDFPDPNLEAAIRDAIDKPDGPIYHQSDLLNLYELYAWDYGISDLSGIEYCYNLEWLDLYNNNITDITLLAGLINLEGLVLDYNQISDISAIVSNSGINSGDWVGLACNNLDLSPGSQTKDDIQTLIGKGVAVEYIPQNIDTEVDFPDPNLEAAIRDALDKPAGPVYHQCDLLNLYELDAWDYGISDLSGIEYCYNLEWLCLWDNNIADSSLLAGLNNLLYLDLYGNQISDILPMAGLINMEWLDLGSNQISDITALSGLPNLEELYLSNNQISAISSLVSNPGLSSGDWVGLAYNNLDLTPGSQNMDDIQTLIDRGVGVEYKPQNGDFEVVFPDLALEEALRNAIDKPSGPIYQSDLVSLIELDAGNGWISDLSGIEYCYNLEWLDLGDNNIADISPLAGLTIMKKLDLDRNQISDITPLSGLTDILELDLNSNYISDISPLVSNAGLSSGDWVDLSYNNLDLTPGSQNMDDIQAFVDRGVNCDYEPQNEFEGYFLDPNLEEAIRVAIGEFFRPIYQTDLENLTEVDAWGFGISDLSGIEYCCNLEWLVLRDNITTDISPLAGLIKLKGLNLGLNQISDITPLAGMTKLEGLNLDENQVSDISALCGLTNLEGLDLQNNLISDISPLVSNPGISSGDRVYLYYNYLDLTPGSQDMDDLQALVDRGVEVEYDPQNTVDLADICISIRLQGHSRPDTGWEVPVTVNLFIPGADVLSDTPLYTFDLTTTKDGDYAIAQAEGMEPGTYDITIVSPHCLTNVKRNVPVGETTTNVDMDTLLDGNANDDHNINISDFGILASTYGKRQGDEGFDERSDFDRNGKINIADFGILAANYVKSSPVEVP
ncbi:MAG: leucine-rich repeat domain-containing protein [Dehalococcoidales bacterium]|nr:leucine-rich repeat domain-containing protein [Dehalococcoidales bacterium]